jgi:hypothetical protein
VSKVIVFISCIAFVSNAAGISFELTSNKIYLPTRINDQGPYEFILDTGSISNVVDMERAKALRIAQAGSYEVRGAGEGSLQASTAKAVVLSLDNATLPEESVEVLPINKAISFSEGRKVDGLLGCPFFNHFVVEIDYSNHQANIYEPDKFRYAGHGNSIPIEIARGNIFVKAAIFLPNAERIEGRFLVDTAWRSALSLSTSFVRKHKLLAMTRTIMATAGVGIGGPTQDPIGRIGSLELGRYTIKDPFTEFSESKTGVLADDGFSGIIGAEVLRRFTVIFDYPNHRMILEPNAQFTEPFEFDMSGLFLTAEGENLRTFKAYKVIPGSPASEAGLHEGDLIETIDDQSAADFSLEQIRQMFRKEGKVYRLKIRRGQALLEAEIRLRRLV